MNYSNFVWGGTVRPPPKSQIYIFYVLFFSLALQPRVGYGLLVHEVS
jgi:hypothetical protein